MFIYRKYVEFIKNKYSKLLQTASLEIKTTLCHTDELR